MTSQFLWKVRWMFPLASGWYADLTFVKAQKKDKQITIIVVRGVHPRASVSTEVMCVKPHYVMMLFHPSHCDISSFCSSLSLPPIFQKDTFVDYRGCMLVDRQRPRL
ncbi:hypothetical protein CEXT_699321 [Caerostris extrusa]|uniref:Secreted protein n=1 Tax=Caerostris extrusa TaxID=172846 RepID=A0AAV4NGW8_CAEEX|nr:hypothetical protein CEXT_699321 [Caerostris extrusa]